MVTRPHHRHVSRRAKIKRKATKVTHVWKRTIQPRNITKFPSLCLRPKLEQFNESHVKRPLMLSANVRTNVSMYFWAMNLLIFIRVKLPPSLIHDRACHWAGKKWRMNMFASKYRAIASIWKGILHKCIKEDN